VSSRYHHRVLRGQRTPVGSHSPNAFGLHDMHGNVWEWCLDGRRVYASDAIIDPLIESDAAAPRVVRGGGYQANAVRLRSATRTADPPDHATPVKGFRVLLEMPSPRNKVASE
jgi:formylglycine-generating enzyme required for sulfatase activity